MDRLISETGKDFLPTRVLEPRDLVEGSYEPFDNPTIIRTDVSFGLTGVEKIQETSRTVLFCHSNNDRKRLTAGPESTDIQEILDNYKEKTGSEVDYVIACNPHRVKLKNCGGYIEGKPIALLSNRDGQFILSVLMLDRSSEYKIVKTT